MKNAALTLSAAMAAAMLLATPAHAVEIIAGCFQPYASDGPNELMETHDLDSVEITFSKAPGGGFIGSRTWSFEGGQSYSSSETLVPSQMVITPTMATNLGLGDLSSTSDYITLTLTETTDESQLHRRVERHIDGVTSSNATVCDWDDCKLATVELNSFMMYALRK